MSLIVALILGCVIFGAVLKDKYTVPKNWNKEDFDKHIYDILSSTSGKRK